MRAVDDVQEAAGAGGNALRAIYGDKPATYYGAARHDIVALLKTDQSSAVLELGCGAGGTGAATLAAGKAGRYVGIELSESAAALARDRLTEVVVGDVGELDLARFQGQFDALIVSEVLEHLTDPWGVLRRLGQCLKPGAMIYASSPNVAHWKVIAGLLSGRFDYQDKGVMDRTHLRWFTPATYSQMFVDTGFTVLEVRPVTPLKARLRMLDRVTGGRFRHLFHTQTMVVATRKA